LHRCCSPAAIGRAGSWLSVWASTPARCGESPESLLAHLCIIGRPFELVDGGGSLPDIKAAHARVGAALGC